MEIPPTNYDELLTGWPASCPTRSLRVSYVQRGTAVPPEAAWDGGGSAQESGTLVSRRAPHGELPLVGPRVITDR